MGMATYVTFGYFISSYLAVIAVFSHHKRLRIRLRHRGDHDARRSDNFSIHLRQHRIQQIVLIQRDRDKHESQSTPVLWAAVEMR